MTKPQSTRVPAPARRRAALLWGASVATLITAIGVSAVRAQSIGALMAATHQATVLTTAATTAATVTPAPSAAMAGAAARALRAQTQVNQAVSMAQQAQSAARAAAAAMVSTVPNGLGLGALQAVSHPILATADTTGLTTWQGAAAPTADATNTKVTVVQNDPRAILSWTSFNVGQQTTLTFQQQKNGVDQAGWTVLNRVVGQLNPTTGLRDQAGSPSQILGAIKAPGTVLVIDQNGIIFGGAAQINVGSLVATSLEIGHAQEFVTQSTQAPLNIAQRNSEFLNFGLLGYAEQQANATTLAIDAFSTQEARIFTNDPLVEGTVQVAAGASLNSANGGYLMLLAPNVVNAGQVSSTDGEIALQSGRHIQLTASAGDANSIDADVRGLVVTSAVVSGADTPNSVVNTANAVIQAPRGYVSLGAAGATGSVLDAGVITSTTSVSRNGYVNLSGPTITLAPGAVISIAADTSADTIPQDATSLGAFKTSRVRIGDTGSVIDIGQNSLIYAPSANIGIGAHPGATFFTEPTNALTGVTVEAGATIDAAGLTDVLILASRNALKIDPVKGNELANAPAFRNGFLNGATVYLDPRLSGVTANGVAWVGSPLISAAAFAQQVGVSAAELLTRGGSVTLGTAAYAPPATGGAATPIPAVVVKAGAVVDIGGGWKTYQAGVVQESYLVDTSGQVIPISQANLDATYVAVYQGYVASQPRWGINRVYIDPLLTGSHFAGQYSEGADAGSLTIKSSAAVLDGALFANAYAGPEQILGAAPGTGSGGAASGSAFGDLRHLQGASSQLPAGGYLDIQAQGVDVNGAQVGGGDIHIVAASAYAPFTGSAPPTGRLDAISLNAEALSGAGLSQLTVQTSGAVDVAAGAAIDLAAGGVFKALAGGAITVEGSITAASGAIDLTTANIGGSVFAPQVIQPGTFDIVIGGALSVAGRWANDFNANAGQIVGSAYLNGGRITLSAAPRVYAGGASAAFADPKTGAANTLADASGSLLINQGALLDVSGGGYVSPTGGLTLTAKGGNLSLYDDTSYFQFDNYTASPIPGGLSGFRVVGALGVVSVNPDRINAHVSIADGSIRAQGFGGGGTFTLTTPSFALGATSVTGPGGGAVLPLDFFSKSGFAVFGITSYGTNFSANSFNNGLGGYNAVLATQVVTVGAGQNLSLTQSVFSPLVTSDQIAALRSLGSGSSLYSVLASTIPPDAWDQKPVSLSLGGLLELHVASGGQVTGSAGAGLTVSQLWNEGVIRLPGGTITQSEILPSHYASGAALGVHSLTGVNQAQATGAPIYLLGDLNAGEGVRLAAGGVTDLSGVAIVNPRAAPAGNVVPADFTDGKVIDGGSLISTNAFVNAGSLFHNPAQVDGRLNNTTAGISEILTAEPGSVVDLAGAEASFDRPIAPVAPLGTGANVSYALTAIWSNGGALTLNSGGFIGGALIDAHGGAPPALGGILAVLNPVLYQNDPATPTLGAVAAKGVSDAGFASFVALGRLTSVGDVTLTLPRAVFVGSPARPNATVTADAYSPVIGSGGALEIDAPYIGLAGAFQAVSNPNPGGVGTTSTTNSVLLKADAIDVTGAVVFDPSAGHVTLSTTGDLRLIGVAPIPNPQTGLAASTLEGQLAVNGDLTLRAAQVYPTTGSTFTVTASGSQGVIRIESAGGAAPATPYSAGGSLLIQAPGIEQAGVVRAPLGSLTLGSDTATAFAPATTSLILAAGGVTSVSADGLTIPYGTTTDQKEWFFTPTVTNPLTAPPAGVLRLAGQSVSVQPGATVDLKGGGDVYAYEFISGTGGTRDVLDRFNADPYSTTSGYQYPDGRQVYAIVPGLSNATVAALDPVYSTDYAALYGPTGVGRRVYLNAAPNLAAGWYTLLPAKYALLPGGLRIVQDTGAATPPPVAGVVRPDGTVVTSGYFGVAGLDTRSAGLGVFDIQSQSVFRAESRIALTYGNATFAALAAKNNALVPQLPIDAGRLILDPVSTLDIEATFQTSPASGGRGSQVDIGGAALYIYKAGTLAAPSASTLAAADGPLIELTDTSLDNLGASSLLIGGVRTDNADGTTNLLVSTHAIAVASGATLTGPEIILASGSSTQADGTVAVAQLTIADTASITAQGSLTNPASGAYVVDGLVTTVNSSGEPLTTRVQSALGGFARVSVGLQRLVTRIHLDPNLDTTTYAGSIAVGRATLSGSSVELATSGALAISDSVVLNATSLALGAGQIAFGTRNPDPTGAALLITPTLQATIAKAASLMLQSGGRLLLASGTYSFGDLGLDTPGLAETTAGGVTLNTGRLSLSNSGAAQAGCVTTFNLACSNDSLIVNADQIAFGSGSMATSGFARSVSLNAANGVFVDGAANFDAGSSVLAINTPFLGDRGAGTPGATAPSLTLASTTRSSRAVPTGTPGTVVAGPVTTTIVATAGGALIRTVTTAGEIDIGSATAGSTFTTAPAGTPGSNLTINGGKVKVTGSDLRATAGTLQITSATDIAISGARLETPSYARTFGDAADSASISAPGGLLTLKAMVGDIAIAGDSVLAVGGPKGQAGSISLSSPDGAVYAHNAAGTVVTLSSVFSTGGLGGASLNLDTNGAFALDAFAAPGGAGQFFNGAISVRSGTGDLTLAAGQTLKASSVDLVADGGQIADSGVIDTSGASGGNVGLYGARGVHLASGALIDTRALGNGPSSTLQAIGGNVTLGVDGTGAIAVDTGATIDAGAVETSDRLVSLNRTNGAYYTYVAGDVGGTVTLRAPIIVRPGGDTVNVAVGGAVTGASSIVLEAFQRFDLTTLADKTRYVGVTIANGAATLDLGAAKTGLVNPLADANGPLVRFVQGFNVSAAYGALGGLGSQANFHARPGIELDYSGNIVLGSNWNLAAGVVNVKAAVAAGLLTPDPGLPGQYAVVAGSEGRLLADYTTATYRVGGSFLGEPGVLSLRAGGNLDLQGSISDGFFQFRDQTDPGYLNYAIGGGSRVYQASLATGCNTSDCSNVSTYGPTVSPNNYVNIVFPNATGLTADPFNNPSAPYSAAANSPAALGSLPNHGGDPLGSAELFPLLPTPGATARPVESWSYRLVAGADLAGAVGKPGADPLSVVQGSTAAVTVEGQHVYSYGATKGVVSFAPSLNIQDFNSVSLPAADWYSAFTSADQTGLSADAYTLIDYSAAFNGTRNLISGVAKDFLALHPGDQAQLIAPGFIETSLSVAADFLTYVSNHFAPIAQTYVPPPENVPARLTYAVAPSLVRTGTGSIQIAASGNIDLRNGVTPMILNTAGVLTKAPSASTHLGGAAIYTAGHLADLSVRTATDLATGQVFSVDPGANVVASDNFTTDPVLAYGYGVRKGLAGILVANPVHAEGGGSVILDAGVDVLSRRNTFLESRLGGVGVNPGVGGAAPGAWIGSGDQPWRTGVTLSTVDVSINPQLFSEGVATLAGGDISVRAGRDISDLSLVATDSLVTAGIGGGPASGALAMFGGGDVTATAGRYILGGRLDVAAGHAILDAGGSVISAGRIIEIGLSQTPTLVDNTLRVRLSDGAVAIGAAGSVELQGVGALGVHSSGINAVGFYSAGSGLSILADRTVTIDNIGNELLTDGSPASGFAKSAVLPGSLSAVSLTDSLSVSASSTDVLLYPDATGTLSLFAGGDIAPATIAQLDSDPSLLPGAFSSFALRDGGVAAGLTFVFPTILPNTSDVVLRQLHNSSSTHAGDATPNRIVAGGDINGAILSLSKQTRIQAGRDIINMVFFGQNLTAGDLTRITAGRDITATTKLVAPLAGVNPQRLFGPELAAVQGDTFVLGGPGALFVEAGRDAGPFLNSAVTNGFANNGGVDTVTGVLTYGGGIITVGNLRNPWLAAQSADIFTEFGVAKGQNFQGLIATYLDPANVANLQGYEFLQTTDANGAPGADRAKPIYGLSLVDWITSIAPDIVNRYDTTAGVTAPGPNAPALVQYALSLKNGHLATFAEALTYLPQLSDRKLPLIPWLLLNEGDKLRAAYGTEDVTYQQAYGAFLGLPNLTQREFLLKDVYFNELIQTSLPDSGSYLRYSRGYQAVNTLFPGAYGYTQNGLAGGPAGASTPVATGDLDLRLATIQTDQGGDITILGPGGRVLAGSTVSTSVQASRRVYDGGRLNTGGVPNSPFAAAITAIPVAYEGVLTLQGGAINSFTDGDFLLNQSRAFSEAGGDIAIWSSNADVNAGQGPRTGADIPPVVVRIDENAFSIVNASGAVSGAGIGAFQPDKTGQAPDVFLIAPRGTVDAGDAGVRSAGNVFIAAFQVANANAIQAQGAVSGDQSPAAANLGVQSSGNAASAAAVQAAQAVASAGSGQSERPMVVVDVLGFLADEPDSCSDDDRKRGKCY